MTKKTEQPAVARFSEGPWEIREPHEGYLEILGGFDADANDDGRVIGHCDIVCYVDDNQREEANANLIASAPDLYAALRNLLKELDEDPTGLQALYAMNGAKAALAKAVPQPEHVNKDTVEEHR